MPQMRSGFSQAVEPKLGKGRGIHVSPKKLSNVLANEDADMDTEEWTEQEGREDRVTGKKAVYKPGKQE